MPAVVQGRVYRLRMYYSHVVGPIGEGEMNDEWNEETGRHWARQQERYDRMLAGLTPHLMKAAEIPVDGRVLDVGCGNGEIGLIAARTATEGKVLGIDISAPMLAEARGRVEQEGLANLRFKRADAQTHSFEADGFDVAMSRFGVMFFDDPRTAFANIAGALRPGGHLAFLCWQEPMRNEYLLIPMGALAAFAAPPDLGEPGAPGPFSLADPARIRKLLEPSFGDISIEPISEKVRLGSDVPDVLDYVRDLPAARGMLDSLDLATQADALHAVGEALRPFETDDGVLLDSAAWLFTAHR